MPNKEIYEFSIIRMVPRVERGEYINIGVILFSKRQNFIGIRFHLDESRLRALSADIDLNEIQSHLEAWKQICEGSSSAGKIATLPIHERFRFLTAPKSTVIQCSAVHPGRSDQPEKELDHLFAQYVL